MLFETTTNFLLVVALTVIQSVTPVSATFGNSAYWFTDGGVNAPFTYFESTLLVPPIPASTAWQTLFMWPGLQSLDTATNFMPINNGVLQPVLTYGTSCAPNPNNLNIDVDTTWWISAQYVNTIGNEPGYTGCFGGNRMAVSPGDSLTIVMELEQGSTVWTQTLTSQNTGESVSFSIDMKGQAQAWASIVTEYSGQWLSPPPVFEFSNIVLKAAESSPSFCTYNPNIGSLPGASLECATPVIQGSTCTISQCTFNGQSSDTNNNN